MGIRLTIIINKTLLLAKFSCNIISTTAPAHTHTLCATSNILNSIFLNSMVYTTFYVVLFNSSSVVVYSISVVLCSTTHRTVPPLLLNCSRYIMLCSIYVLVFHFLVHLQS